jgi:hypothetical protein
MENVYVTCGKLKLDDAWLNGTGLNLMMLAREDGWIVGWIYLTDVDKYARSAQIGYGVRPHARGHPSRNRHGTQQTPA